MTAPARTHPGVNGKAPVADATQRDEPAWPEPLADEALYGLAGDVVRTIAPNTEADPAALLLNFLVAAGSAIGRGPHARVGATRHYSNLFAVLVGETAKGLSVII